MPVNSEVTAWVSGRTFSLCTFFLLAGSLFAHSFLKNGRRPALALYWLASAAALLSHESGALLTPLVALIAVPSPGKPFQRRLFFLLAAVSGGNALVYLWLRHIAGAAIPAASLRLLWEGLIHAGQAIGTYASWMILPLQLSIDRSPELTAIQSPVAVWLALVASVALVGCGVIAFRQSRRPRPAMDVTGIYSVLWYCAALPGNSRALHLSGFGRIRHRFGLRDLLGPSPVPGRWTRRPGFMGGLGRMADT